MTSVDAASSGARPDAAARAGAGHDGAAAASWSGRRVLITGGLGFIGSNLAIALVDRGADVAILDNLMPSYGGNRFNLSPVADRVRTVVGDVRDDGLLPTLLEGRDVVFHLAGQTSHLDSMHDPLTDLAMNCAAHLTLLEACRHRNPAARLVFASTRQIYGRPDAVPVAEDHPLRPTDVNGIHKLAAESYHLLYHRVYGLPTTALRLTNTYGPRMRIKDARQTFLGVWIRAAVEGGAFEVWGGDQLRDLSYVDDCVHALLLAADAPTVVGRAWNVGGDEVVSLRALAEALIAVAGSGRAVVCPFPPERQAIDVGNYAADDRAFRAATGWAPRVPLADGLARTIAYYREHIARYV